MHRQNIQHSPSMSLPFGWHQSNQGNAGSAYLETWWRVRIKCGGEEKMVWERNWQLDTTCINLWVFQSTSCLFMQFQDVSCRFHQFPRSLSRWNLRAMFVNNSTFCSAWNHLQSCRGDRNKTYYEMPKHDPCQRHNSSWWYMLILYRWIKIACDPVYNGWAQCSWHLELEHSPKKNITYINLHYDDVSNVSMVRAHQEVGRECPRFCQAATLPWMSLWCLLVETAVSLSRPGPHLPIRRRYPRANQTTSLLGTWQPQPKQEWCVVLFCEPPQLQS